MANTLRERFREEIGHSSIKTTAIYAHVTAMSEAQAIEVLSELMEPL